MAAPVLVLLILAAWHSVRHTVCRMDIGRGSLCAEKQSNAARDWGSAVPP